MENSRSALRDSKQRAPFRLGAVALDCVGDLPIIEGKHLRL